MLGEFGKFIAGYDGICLVWIDGAQLSRSSEMDMIQSGEDVPANSSNVTRTMKE